MTRTMTATEFQKLPRAKGRPVRRVAGTMNKTEAAYADKLRLRQLGSFGPDVVWFAFDSIRLRLAENTHYTPDFLVMLSDGTLEVHEVKSVFIEDDSMVKIKVAAAMYPFRFVLAVCEEKRGVRTWKLRDWNGDDRLDPAGEKARE